MRANRSEYLASPRCLAAEIPVAVQREAKHSEPF
jgi:hypothetical protein